MAVVSLRGDYKQILETLLLMFGSINQCGYRTALIRFNLSETGVGFHATSDFSSASSIKDFSVDTS